MRIIYLDIDSLRPDHMGCYGYGRETTPNLDRIAAKGMRFNNCFTASSPCVPSRASFMSVRFGINHGALTHWGPGSEFYYPEGVRHSTRFPFFTRYIREAGYKAVTFSSFADRHHAWWYHAGWSEVHAHTLQGGKEQAHEVNAAALPWLRAHGKEDNYFLHIQYWDPHRNYTMPQRYADLFAGQPVPSFPSEEAIQQHRNDTFFSSARFLHRNHTSKIVSPIPDAMPLQIGNRNDFAQMINAYDGAIRYMDEHVGAMLDVLEELGISEDTCFVISADHGESMGEQGIYIDHVCATESVHHIPLIMTFPGTARPASSWDGMIYNVDVMATLADLIGLPIPEGWDGQPFTPALKGEAREGREYLVMDHALYTCQRAVRDSRWYFIRTYHPGLYDFDEVTLYDLHEDPHQLVNAASGRPDIVKEMDHRLMTWLHEQLGKPGHRGDPMQKVVQTGPWKYTTLEEWVARLNQEGLHEEADRLLNRVAWKE